QHIDKAFEVGIDIGLGMINRRPHAGLSGQMDHHWKSMLGKKCAHRRTICKIHLYEAEPGVSEQDIETRPLQSCVIIIVEIVQPYDIASLGQQPASGVKTDEA